MSLTTCCSWLTPGAGLAVPSRPPSGAAQLPLERNPEEPLRPQNVPCDARLLTFLSSLRCRRRRCVGPNNAATPTRSARASTASPSARWPSWSVSGPTARPARSARSILPCPLSRRRRRRNSSHLSTRHAAAAEGEPDSHISGGFGVLLRHLSGGLPISLGRRVTRVDSTRAAAGGGVRVSASVSGGGEELLSARAAVVAVPLSVLQDGDIQFAPPLPEATARAARTLGWQRDGCKILCAPRLQPARRYSPLIHAPLKHLLIPPECDCVWLTESRAHGTSGPRRRYRYPQCPLRPEALGGCRPGWDHLLRRRVPRAPSAPLPRALRFAQ